MKSKPPSDPSSPAPRGRPNRAWVVRRADWPPGEYHVMFGDTAPSWAEPDAYLLELRDQWFPIATAPKDGTPILAWCVHGADPYTLDDGQTLTLYGAHTEGLSHVEDGPHVLVWGGGFDDRTYEDPNGAWLPDWWFLRGSNFEITANPVGWVPVPMADPHYPG